MSTRTRIEINHDRLRDLQERPELLALIMSELGVSNHNGVLNEASVTKPHEEKERNQLSTSLYVPVIAGQAAQTRERMHQI
jgi:hypothetical protein